MSRADQNLVTFGRADDGVEHRMLGAADRESPAIGGLVGPPRVDSVESGAVEHDPESGVERDGREHDSA